MERLAVSLKATALGILAKAIFFLPMLAVILVVFLGGIFHRVPPADCSHWLG